MVLLKCVRGGLFSTGLLPVCIVNVEGTRVLKRVWPVLPSPVLMIYSAFVLRSYLGDKVAYRGSRLAFENTPEAVEYRHYSPRVSKIVHTLD